MTLPPLADARLVPALPFASLSHGGARSVVIGVGVVGSALATSGWLGWIFPSPDDPTLAALGGIVAPTCVLMAAFLCVVTRPARTRVSGLARMALGSPFGALNGIVIVIGLSLIVGPPGGSGAFVVAAGIFGGLVAVPYVVALIPLAIGWFTFATRHTHEASDRLCLRAGVWLTGVALGCAGLGAYVMRDRSNGVSAWLQLIGPALVTTVLGLALVGYATFRLLGRKRWLAAVRAGEVMSFRILPVRGVSVAHLDYLFDPPTADPARPEIVVAWVTPGEGGYRDAGQRVPLAIVG